ncbi:MAG: hypothetical protein PVG56_02275 [Anaerolineae bacterium]
MNLKLRRLVRTPSSEQYALFDSDRTDDNFDPMSIGKLDLHYTVDGIYGTFLLWKQAIESLPPGQVQALVEATLEELAEPMGLAAFYAIEFFSPELGGYELYSNETEDEDEDEAGPEDVDDTEQT